jgi:hypothetical protein
MALSLIPLLLNEKTMIILFTVNKKSVTYVLVTRWYSKITNYQLPITNYKNPIQLN